MALLLTTLLLWPLTTAHLITSPARLSIPTGYPNVAVNVDGLFGRLPGHQLFKRATDYCDDHPPPDGFHCATGTCYTGSDGFVGCCSTTSCYARTTCIDYTSSPTTSCDNNYGGCIQCTNSALPYCYTQTNEVANQYVFWCNTAPGTQTVAWTNGITAGSMADAPPVSTSSSSTSSTTRSSSISSSTPAPASSVTSASSTSGAAVGDATTAPANAAQDSGDDNSPSTGAIAGIAVGAAAAVAIIAFLLWFFRRKIFPAGALKKRPFSSGATSYETQVDSIPRKESAETKHDSVLPPPNSPLGSSPRNPPPASPRSPPPASPTFSNHDQAVNTPLRYTVTNPDAIAMPTGVAEAPSRHPSPQISPVASSFASPQSNSTGFPSPAPSQRPFTPSHPQHSYVPYTPSNYQGEAPGSVPRTSSMQPPSLPQEYSAATLPSRGEYSSWPYLSAENALAGGWRNDGSPGRGPQGGGS